MKRNILNILLITVVLLLTACGSNSKRDPIVLDRNSTDGSSTVYHLINETSVVEVNAADETYIISADVVNGQGVGISGVDVSVSAVSGLEFGKISSASTVQTDEGGHAIFTYTAPANITPVDGQSTNITLSVTIDGKTVSKNVQIKFRKLSGDVSDIFLVNETGMVNVHFDNEEKTISIDVVNGNGIGVEGQEVSISAVPGVRFGSISGASTVTTNAGGHAVFNYTAPSDISAVDGESTTLTLSTMKNSNRIAKQVQLTFNKLYVDTNRTVPVVTTTTPAVTLSSNSQNIELVISVFDDVTKAPYTNGNVKVSLPDKSLQGVDVGTFTAYVVPVENGRAVFNYTGPQNLKTLIDNNDLNAIFSFSHEANPSNTTTITVRYTLQDGYVPANYILSTSSADGNQTMGLELLKTFTAYLKDDKGTLIPDNKINRITIASQNTTIGKLVSGGSEVNTITLTGANAVNSKSFAVQTLRLSGLLPIKIVVDFTDANGKAASRSIVMNVVVFSGPPTSISISYAGVVLDEAHASYVEKFSIAVTDSYNNPVNTRPYVAVGAMVEYAVDGSSPTGTRATTSPRLWHGTNDSKGNLESIGGNKAQFVASGETFKYVDFANDKMVLFGEGFVFEALGKWDITDNTDSVLGLVDSYSGTSRSNLLYAVGHNHRQDLCANDARKYIGTMKATNYQLDSQGRALVDFQYDYHLTGKDIMVWANLTGLQADNNKVGRLGVAQKHTLRGMGFYAAPTGGYGLPKFSAADDYRFDIHHENAPEWYRNGHFGYSITGKCRVHNVVDWSNNHDARDCTNTTGYVILRVSNPSDKDCTIQVTNIAVSQEFTRVNDF